MAGLTRRDVLRLGAGGALAFAGGGLAWADGPGTGAEKQKKARGPAVIVVWLQGGPSQLETFDPHPGSATGGPTKAIATSQKEVKIAEHYPRLAERLHRFALVRSLVTTEGEHQRGTHLLRTGWPLSPTVPHPALTAVVANDLAPAGLEVPAHVALLSKDPPRGGYLGAPLDAFAVGDPKEPLEDLVAPAGLTRLDARLDALAKLEAAFRKGRERRCDATQHEALARRARSMMGSKQVAAFSLAGEPASLLQAYGDSAFGRACLVARRLVEQGVPAVEVTLDGWDTHTSNFEQHAKLADPLDRGLSALLDDLDGRGLLSSTLVLCTGEFGRTPSVNPFDGRDHWTRGFSALLAGRGLRTNQVVGSTDPKGEGQPQEPVAVPDLFATLYQALGIDTTRWFQTAAGRPVRLNEAKPIARLLA